MMAVATGSYLVAYPQIAGLAPSLVLLRGTRRLLSQLALLCVILVLLLLLLLHLVLLLVILLIVILLALLLLLLLLIVILLAPLCLLLLLLLLVAPLWPCAAVLASLASAAWLHAQLATQTWWRYIVVWVPHSSPSASPPASLPHQPWPGQMHG